MHLIWESAIWTRKLNVAEKWHNQRSKSALFPQKVQASFVFTRGGGNNVSMLLYLVTSAIIYHLIKSAASFSSGSSFLFFISQKKIEQHRLRAVPARHARRRAPSGWPESTRGKAVQRRPPASAPVCQLSTSQGRLGRTGPLNKASAFSAVHFK